MIIGGITLNDHIYLPSYTSGNCAIILNSNTIRVFESTPVLGQQVSYKDYFIKSDYIYNSGYFTLSSSDNLPSCIVDSRITDDFYYRQDLPSVLFIFICFAFICFWLPWKLLTVIFRRWHH